MTSAQALKQLTPAQRRLFDLLYERRAADGVHLTYHERRSFSALKHLGWAEVADVDRVGVHARITALGKLIAGPVAFVPERRA